LTGENLATARWEDARHWISIYGDLLEFKRGLLDRVERDLVKLRPEAREAAAADIGLIETQMHGYQARIDLWYRRVWELQGLWIDPESRVVRHKGREATLTNRESELLGFLLAHPHRYFPAEQILSGAWADSALSPEEVRNYVKRLRRILSDLEVPVELANRPRRGYGLVFRDGA
jgi:DNA-binding response OmpR family regulator